MLCSFLFLKDQTRKTRCTQLNEDLVTINQSFLLENGQRPGQTMRLYRDKLLSIFELFESHDS